MSVQDVNFAALDEKPSSSSSGISAPAPAPQQIPQIPQQVQVQPTYTMLPNGQIQVLFTLPAGAMLPQSQQPAQMAYGSFPQQQARPTMYPYLHQSYQYPAPPPTVIQQYPVMQHSTPLLPPPPPDTLAIVSLVSFVIGLFTFVPYLASLIASFLMVKRGYFTTAGKQALVLIFTIIELIAWLFCASFSWYMTDNYWHPVYYGWTAIVAWVGIAILIGIARVAICWQAGKHFQAARCARIPM